MKPLLKIGSSWLAVAVGLLVGILALARFGMAWLPVNDDLPGSLLRWIEYAGSALLGAAFLAASIIALRDRKRAGTAFLAFMPITVFCLAYPSAGYMVWRSDGGWFEPPDIPTAIGLTVLFYLPIYISILLVRYRKRSVYYLLAIAALLALIVFSTSHWARAFLPPFAGWSAPFLAFGLFWLGTNQLGWPSLLQRRARSLGRRLATAFLAFLVIAIADVMLTFGLSAAGSSLFSPDCSTKAIIVRPESPHHAVFTARLIFVGPSLEALTRDSNIFRDSKTPGTNNPRSGDWGIGIVQDRFWGVPHWPRVVLLTNHIYWKGETYFVDGSREHGILTRILPIVDGRTGCSRTQPVQYAAVDLRILREPPSPTGGRLIGYVRSPETFAFGLAPPKYPKFIPDMRISVTGPDGTLIATTDQTGIYQLDNLSAGDYMLEIHLPDDKMATSSAEGSSTIKIHMGSRTTAEQSFGLLWNGRIEGRVTNTSGHPVQVHVVLLRSSTQLPRSWFGEVLSKTDGSYRFNKIPPGRYTVMVETRRNGSSAQVQFYPAKARAEDAQWFELSEGQKITRIDFKIR